MINKEFLVSVIIPCYNAEKYISECINSLLAQHHADLEIICVDNNSVDNTLLILEKYAEEYPIKIRLLKEFQKGAAAARNAGLKSAKGKWIQFLDADDILLPEKIANQLSLKGIYNSDMIVGNYILETQEQVKIETDQDLWQGLIKGRLGYTCSNLFRKDVLINVNGWDNIQSSQEYNLMFKILKISERVIFDNKFNTIKKEKNFNSISNSNRSGNWLRYIELRAMVWEYLKENNKLTVALENTLKINIFDSIRILNGYDREEGALAYDKFVKGRFNPIASAATSTNYLKIYKLLGFRTTERIKMIFKQE